MLPSQDSTPWSVCGCSFEKQDGEPISSDADVSLYLYHEALIEISVELPLQSLLYSTPASLAGDDYQGRSEACGSNPTHSQSYLEWGKGNGSTSIPFSAIEKLRTHSDTHFFPSFFLL